MVSATPGDPSPWRAEIEKTYGQPLPDVTWEWLKGEHYIAELEEGGGVTIAYVVDKLRAINAAAPAAHTRAGRRVLAAGSPSESRFAGINSRMQALAEVIAWRAARNWTVTSFRKRRLADKLIAPDEVTTWIDTTYHKHRPARWPSSPSPAQATNVRGKFALWPHAHLVIEWLDAGEQTTRVWCVPTRGPLAELAKLSAKLADQWDWNPALATNFVLTGETPARPGIRGVSFRTRHGSDDDYGSYHLMSVPCVIDVEVTPEELAGWWRGLRTAIGISGRKPMGEKAVQLALFAHSCKETSTIAEDMHRWNKQAPEEWRYRDYRAFRTAAVAAMNSLNHPAAGSSLPWDGPGPAV